MDCITAEEWQVLSFFEVDPVPADPGVAWPYNDFLYEVRQGSVVLTCSIAPAYRDVRITLKFSEALVYELNAVGVTDVRYTNDSGSESLDIVLDQHDRLRLQVKPHIAISQRVDGAADA